MATKQIPNAVCESLAPNARVLRFVRPDLRSVLNDQEPVEDCLLYREIHNLAMADLQKGQTLIINLGIIDWFPTTFYSLLLKVRETVEARNARLFICCLTPNIREGFDLFGGDKLFTIASTESQALYEAQK